VFSVLQGSAEALIIVRWKNIASVNCLLS